MSKKFLHWTPITAFCFERKFRCKNCSERYFCEKRKINNIYGLKQIKYAALQTFANRGLCGFQDALNSIGQEKNRIKDLEL